MTPLQIEIVVLNGLKLAARQFEAMAKNAAHPKSLREQFIVQAADALQAVELIEVGVFVIAEKPPLASTVFPDLRSAVSSSPLTGEHADDAPRRAATPAVAGNSGGIPFAQVILDATREWECAFGFVHPVGTPCVGKCVP